ncbi:MAG: LLM class flavin-dependent oxidoreductase [Ancrocorticia populi]|uniref:LLM class flavin-dependent oxidoreductase n=2 Tax=Ancrocorticia populi TaxID=2175228 RepID=UPI003F938C09
MKLSVLDLIPLRSGQTSRDALLASQALAHEADRLGYTRYWVAEHHNMEAIVSTVPAVLIPFLAEGTSQIRFGSGGVMLANHAPFAVAEQFALLSEMLPGRVDLGLGRAPGSDQLTAAVLRQALPGDGVQNYVRDVTLLRELLGGGETPVGERVHVEISGRPFDLSATPAMSTAPDIWLLGSSAYSAEAAGQLGLPYVFANHFGMPGIDETLRLYRESFIPSASFPEPRTLVPVNVVVAENAEEANKLALPQKLSNARLRSGGKVEPQATVDEMENYDWAAREFMAPAPGPDSMFVGTPEHVAEGISALATRLGADEVMVSPVAGAYAGDDVDRGVRREESLRLLAREIL